ncbi:MAG: small, acid-soluble spore protein, alpha/beta type [Eubacteriales bacterium]|nr:small, acid-soluble spore protein, alpha/beta type [Eubacteriales bacterium]
MAEQTEHVDFEKLEPGDRLKYEVAEELGLLEKVQKGGWKSLSSRETGRIGGVVSRRRKALEAREAEPADHLQ